MKTFLEGAMVILTFYKQILGATKQELLLFSTLRYVLKKNAKLELILAHCGFGRQENKVNPRTAPLWACLI